VTIMNSTTHDDVGILSIADGHMRAAQAKWSSHPGRHFRNPAKGRPDRQGRRALQPPALGSGPGCGALGAGDILRLSIIPRSVTRFADGTMRQPKIRSRFSWAADESLLGCKTNHRR
jgi:hypothetical protein